MLYRAGIQYRAAGKKQEGAFLQRLQRPHHSILPNLNVFAPSNKHAISACKKHYCSLYNLVNLPKSNASCCLLLRCRKLVMLQFSPCYFWINHREIQSINKRLHVTRFKLATCFLWIRQFEYFMANGPLYCTDLGQHKQERASDNGPKQSLSQQHNRRKAELVSILAAVWRGQIGRASCRERV